MLQITLKAARVNADLTQKDVVSILKKKFQMELTRQKLAEFENDSSEVPISLAGKLASIYGVSQENIFFGDKSTLSYTYRLGQSMKNREEVS